MNNNLFPALKSGDIFCVTDPKGWISRIINAHQWLWSIDGESTYSHSGIITDKNGDTFEALYNGIRRSNIFTEYTGRPIIIGRVVGMDDAKFDERFAVVSKYEGKIYPYWRLFLHGIPFLAKFFHQAKLPVCSELVWMFSDLGNPWGITPDIAADRIRHWDEIDMIYEGPCPPGDLM